MGQKWCALALVFCGMALSASPIRTAQASAELAQQKACLACHAIQHSRVGPAYSQVAQRYASRPDAVEYLSNSIKNGGGGRWGMGVMPRQNLTEDEARQLAQWILSLAN
jgi:cytochrome c